MPSRLTRVLNLVALLQSGKIIYKGDIITEAQISEKTFQRDIGTIRNFITDNHYDQYNIVYDRKEKGYRLIDDGRDDLAPSQMLLTGWILLASRSLPKDEMMPILDKLVRNCVPTHEFKKVELLINSEKAHYIEPNHGKNYLQKMWDITNAVHERKYLRIAYEKLSSPESDTQFLMPVGVIFSEFYFYLVAYSCNDEGEQEPTESNCPMIYRIDRIKNYKISDNHFRVPYEDSFDECEFRKRIPFMTGGELRVIRFIYKGDRIEELLDRLPSAEIEEKNEDGYLICAEVYGKGIDCWIHAQGEDIEILDSEVDA